MGIFCDLSEYLFLDDTDEENNGKEIFDTEKYQESFWIGIKEQGYSDDVADIDGGGGCLSGQFKGIK
ncbi:hypothetical protein DDB_G0272392 [Dictyostelium discoideum AX4]|uniref:Uncharacterized protein n=1 Tax=Dictyostelium discoideum TaxID=44689 RepID=Q559Z5_DICDI|nr:hypothetical protein DDB_G0272392 [Dictyostelium discoideum AX4]EAL71348.1 hypothetical protein DDB_G0272392 [Dictyostelium discoideum AX4]|eukprot:XP_645189.1 hypothetical protein DDB_G0272392 [Dictyostelium discoideum AX4]